MKIQNALVWNILDRSQRYFAHVTTVTLSWRVQNIVVTGRVYFTLECFEFSSNFEFDRNRLSGTGAWCQAPGYLHVFHHNYPHLHITGSNLVPPSLHLCYLYTKGFHTVCMCFVSMTNCVFMSFIVFHLCLSEFHLDGLAQNCSDSSALAVELLQSCTKPLISFSCFLYSLDS